MAAATLLLERALNRHRVGDLAGAEELCQAVLSAAPTDADALHLLGLTAYRRGRHDAALAAISRAIALRPEIPLYRGNLGRVLVAAGRRPEAEASFRVAVELDPADPDLQYDLGLVLSHLGRAAEAAARYSAAIDLCPEHSEAHNNLGSALAAVGRTREAEASYRAALRHAPALAAAHANLGALLCRLGRFQEAAASLGQSLVLAPDFPEALNSLGTVHAAGRRLAEAEGCYRKALAFRPTYAEAHNNLGVLLREQGRFDEAEAALGEALRLRPDYAEAETNRGNVLVALGRLPAAEAAYRRALRLAPDEPEAHHGLGVALLLAGRLEEGWSGYEWRWRRRGAAARALAQPLWTGESIGARVLLVHAEQGFGDTIQFCRFVPLLGARRVILEVPWPLARLLSGLAGVERIVVRGETLPEHDLHCPLMSLPQRVGTTLETIPAEVPYLAADAASVAGWRERLRGFPGLSVGLVAAGNPDFAADERRSIDVALLAPLLALRGATFFSLQHGAVASGQPLLGYQGELHDFADWAALIAALDLVIGVDTAAVHLAGALGRPVWLLNRFDTCWRWLRERCDSPWYPTLRQFRQPRPGDWTSVIAAVHDALQQAIAAADASAAPPRGGFPASEGPAILCHC